MNIYLLEQDDVTGYDTYDAIVVAAESEDEARRILPADAHSWNGSHDSWTRSPSEVEVTLLGVVKPGTNKGVVLTSFNAG